MESRVHKNTKRLPSKTASFEDILALVKFLQNYAETNAMLLPGRIPSYNQDDLKLLPLSTTKKVHTLEISNYNIVMIILYRQYGEYTRFAVPRSIQGCWYIPPFVILETTASTDCDYEAPN